MKKFLIALIFSGIYFFNSYSQVADSTVYYKQLDEVVVSKFFQTNYNRELARVRKIYPMALKAKAIMNEFEQEIEKMDKKREQKKYSRKMVKFLKEEFTYSIRDLYTSEGRLLMQLVHRETGKTVNQIIAEYTGDFQAFIYRNLAKMFDQDLNMKYNPERENYYTEIVINDILMGTVEFDAHMDRMTKEEFKVSQKEYKDGVKKMRAENKEIRKNKKKEEKAKK
ncbi:MAG: DUF4294 domain-containing protein [Crocinitomicaceae bacterium]|nr:DUF4294 domain-containing protein [Crocinitomicaceae bacterium]